MRTVRPVRTLWSIESGTDGGRLRTYRRAMRIDEATDAATSTPAPGSHRPRHVGLIMDGNRRWARSRGLADVSLGHRAGAEHLSDFLAWLSARGIEHASVYVLSADNIRRRSPLELGVLFTLIENVIPARVLAAGQWRLHISGNLDLLPTTTREALGRAIEMTRDRPGHLTLAIGYDARADILGAVRRAVAALPADEPGALSVDLISQQLPGGPAKAIDLIIRTGGDSRTSGFFPWQSTSAELHVASCSWPDFSEHDLERALAHYDAVISAGSQGQSTHGREEPGLA